MKILWLCNKALPSAAEAFGIKAGHGGGWMVGLAEDLKNYKDNQLHIAFMNKNSKEIEIKCIENITYFGIPKKLIVPYMYEDEAEEYLSQLVNLINPDVIHIFGTEYPHTLSMMNICPVDKTVISIQGLVSIYSKHYTANLSCFFQLKFNIKDYLLKKVILKQQRDFKSRGEFEVKAIKKAKHIIGRTTWDYACAKQINPRINYYFCNETLRSEFYKHVWDISKCEEHSIFFGQAGYSIKGLHIMLEAMPEILKLYPNAHLYVAGADITKGKSLAAKLGVSYGKHIQGLINKFNLIKHITFTGELDEKQICQQFLRANVFVSASNIENSPNSLGEAMLLGVPCVASAVGGVQTLLKENVEGFIYPFDEPYMLAYYVCEVFGKEFLALEFSQNARTHASNTHNREINLKTINEIYKKIHAQ